MDDATFAAFVAWMRREGITWDDAELELAPRGTAAGGGVRARRALPAAAVVCSIPKAAVLTVRTTEIADVLRERGVRRLIAFVCACCAAESVLTFVARPARFPAAPRFPAWRGGRRGAGAGADV
jgi:hypothetical protein